MENKFIITQISTYSFAFLMFFLPLWRLIDNILLGVLMILFFVTKNKTINIFNLIKTSTIVFVIYIALRSFIDHQLANDFSELLKLLPLLLIPFAFNILTKEQVNKGLFFLFFGILVMQVISSIEVIEYYYFTEGKKVRLSNYSKINQILGFERPYLGFFSALNVIIAYYFFNQKKHLIYLLPILISLVLVIIVSARLSFIIIFLTLLTVLLKKIDTKVKLLIPIIVMIVSSLVYLIVQKNPLSQRFYAIKKDSRTIIWQGAIEQINNTKNYIFGNGGQKEIRDNLLDYYKNRAKYKYPPEKNRYIRVNYNTHNQYLNELIRGGVFGVLLLIFPFCYMFVKNIIKFEIISMLLLFSVFSFGLVENILERQQGVYVFAIILATTNKFYEKK